jgi:hypothetical protein
MVLCTQLRGIGFLGSSYAHVVNARLGGWSGSGLSIKGLFENTTHCSARNAAGGGVSGLLLYPVGSEAQPPSDCSPGFMPQYMANAW